MNMPAATLAKFVKLRANRWHSAPERFEESYIPEPNTGCWLWTGAVARRYGNLTNERGKVVRAHRYAWELHYGPIPNGLFVCHKCDVPLCVNPSHLFLGTPAENTHDMIRKGRKRSRGQPGSSHSQAKLTEGAVLSIRADGRAYRVIAADFGVTKAAITDIKLRRTWRHV